MATKVTITEDSSSPEQLIEAFRLLANGDDVVTQQDLRKARLSPTATSFLSSAMPSLESNGKNERGTEDLAYDCKPYLHNLHSRLKLHTRPAQTVLSWLRLSPDPDWRVPKHSIGQGSCCRSSSLASHVHVYSSYTFLDGHHHTESIPGHASTANAPDSSHP